MLKFDSKMQLPYNDYGSMMRRRFGGRVQKLAIDAGFGCPNRDGRVGRGGCSFCSNEIFSPAYCQESKSLAEQVRSAIEFHRSRRRNADYYLAYFQSGTNTYADVDTLSRAYYEVLNAGDVEGLIIGTRPDCISSEILQLLEEIAHKYYVAVEYGIESVDDATLEHVGRGHNFSVAMEAVELTRQAGIDVGAHFIVGLPNRSRGQILDAVATINELGLNYIKFHQLQIHRHTRIASEWVEHPERFLLGARESLRQYVELMVDILRRLDPAIAVDRLASSSPSRNIIHSPLGGVTVEDVRRAIVGRMEELGALQGDLSEVGIK